MRNPFTNDSANAREPVAIAANTLMSIISDLSDNNEMKMIFGEPVEDSLLVVSHGGDLRLEASWDAGLTDYQAERFLDILDATIAKYLAA